LAKTLVRCQLGYRPFDWVYRGISQSLQGTAGTLPQLGYEWLLNPYRSSVELNSRLPFHCTRSIVELKIARHFTVCYVGFSSTPVYLAPFELQILKIFWKINWDQAVEFTRGIWVAED